MRTKVRKNKLEWDKGNNRQIFFLNMYGKMPVFHD